MVPDSSSYILCTKRNAPDDTEDNVPVKKRKVLHKTDSTVANVDNNMISSDDPKLKDFMSVINCHHDSKLWFMGDRDYVEYAFVGGVDSEQNEEMVENILKAVPDNLMESCIS